MDELIARVEKRTELTRWRSIETFEGRDEVLTEFYAPFAADLEILLSSNVANVVNAWNWDEFAAAQPAIVKPAVDLLRNASRLITLRDVAAAASATYADLQKTKVTFLTGGNTTSSTLAVLLLIHAQMQHLHGTAGHISVSHVSFEDSKNLKRKLKELGQVEFVLLEDAVYSGGSVLKTITTLQSLNMDIHLSVLMPFATREAVKKVESTKVQVFKHKTLPTVFRGISLDALLRADVFYLDSSSSSIKSYLFDVLKLNDRNTLHLMSHKVSDVSMAPYTLLHVGPCFPKSQRVYTVASARSIVKKFSKSRESEESEESENKHAHLHQFACTHFREFEKDFEGTSLIEKCANVPILNPDSRNMAYEGQLAMFS